jgi:hypothetical protein
LLAVVLLVEAMIGAGCTGHGGNAPSTPAGSSPGGPLTSNVPVSFKAGEYRYRFNDITASLVLHGSGATLRILNGSGGELGAPGLYVITGDDRRFDGRVSDAAPIPNGGDVTMDVTFPAQVTAKTVGLVVLLLGSDNMGAFSPVARS